jgi:hypothetical protein
MRFEKKVNALPLAPPGDFVRELQSATGEELDALSSSPSGVSGIPSVLMNKQV